MSDMRGSRVWWLVAGALAVVLAVLVGIAVWPRGGSSPSPTQPRTTAPPSQPASPSDPASPADPDPSEPEPTPSASSPASSGSEETWQTDPVWGGVPPKRLFMAMFERYGDAYDGLEFPERLGRFTRDPSRDKRQVGGAFATYDPPKSEHMGAGAVDLRITPLHGWAHEVEDGNPRQVRDAVCVDSRQGFVRCFVATEDAMITVEHLAAKGPGVDEEVVALLEGLVPFYGDRA